MSDGQHEAAMRARARKGAQEQDQREVLWQALTQAMLAQEKATTALAEMRTALAQAIWAIRNDERM